MLEKFRAPFIYYCDVPNHNDIKSTYYNRLKDIVDNSNDTVVTGWNCDVRTTFNFNIDFLSESFFRDSVIWKPLDQMLNEVDLQQYPTSSKVTGIWANFYEGGEFQEVHDHVGGSRGHFSGIYIIDQKGENKTSFIYNNFWILDKVIHTKDLEDIKEGTVIIFPSNLLHYVNPVEDKRCTISFNIQCEF